MPLSSFPKFTHDLTGSKGNSRLEGEKGAQKSQTPCRSSEKSKHNLLKWPHGGLRLSCLLPLSPLCAERFQLRWLMSPCNSDLQIPSDIPRACLICQLKSWVVLWFQTQEISKSKASWRAMPACSLCAWGFGHERLIRIHNIMMVIILLPNETTAIRSSWKLPRRTSRSLHPVISEVKSRKSWVQRGIATSLVGDVRLVTSPP